MSYRLAQRLQYRGAELGGNLQHVHRRFHREMQAFHDVPHTGSRHGDTAFLAALCTAFLTAFLTAFV